MLVFALISSATIESWPPFLFREALLATPNHGARRSVPLTPRLEWQAETEEHSLLPPPVGAGIHSRGVKGARDVELSCAIQYEVSFRRK
jgi:hypothetical protein